MSAPTPTAFVDPNGIMLEDGYQTLMNFSLLPALCLQIITVKPPGLEGGDPIDQTSMHNDEMRTSAPRALITLTQGTIKAAFDPAVWTQARSIINRNQTITTRLPDGSTLAFYGWLRAIDPDELAEGTRPEMTVTVEPSNRDPITKAEEGPVLTSVVGT